MLLDVLQCVLCNLRPEPRASYLFRAMTESFSTAHPCMNYKHIATAHESFQLKRGSWPNLFSPFQPNSVHLPLRMPRHTSKVAASFARLDSFAMMTYAFPTRHKINFHIRVLPLTPYLCNVAANAESQAKNIMSHFRCNVNFAGGTVS